MNAPPEIEVLYEDNHLLAANKPPGMLTQASGRDEDNLEDRARAWLKTTRGKPGAVFLHAVHRLDREVSGVVLFAATSKALSRLNEQVRARNVRKTYHALVAAPPPSAAGELEHWLAHDEHRARIVEPDSPGGRRSRLRYRLLARHADGVLLEIELQTGRYHQIRVQLAAIGCPILGDARYGGPPWRDGIALHHRLLEIEHPVRRESLRIVAPYPPAWPALAAP